jgi:hypothetical protein
MIVGSPESFRGWNRSQKRPSRRARYDRWDSGLNAPKGHNNIAQGFSPGLVGKEPRPESGARMLASWPHLVQSIAPSATPEFGAAREAVLQKCLVRIAPRDRGVEDAFRAHSAKTENPGLKPWAMLLCPFGAGHEQLPRQRGHSILFPR